MTHLIPTKFVPGATVLSLITLVFALLTPSPARTPRATTVIDFESLPSFGTIVRNQFADRGIIFEPVLSRDYSLVPIPNFAHSGTKAVELCFASEFCTSKLDIKFPTAPQRRVKMWVGFTGQLDRHEPVMVRAFDANGNQVAEDTIVFGPSALGVIPISAPLEVTTPTATIVRVTAGFLRAEPSTGTMFNNGLAFDDIEFDDQGTAPQCNANQPPTFAINQPADGQLVVQNAFTLDANLQSPDPFTTLQISATGSGGTRNFGPTFVSSGHIQIFNLSGLLFPGQNTLVFTARNCRGATQVTRTVHFQSITRTAIRVVNESGANVQTARVYANGRFIGLTDAVGMLSVTPPLSAGTRLVARKLVAESATSRDNHSQGSFQDWKFRVYTASMEVNNDGSLTAQPVNYGSDPNAPQVLRVMRRNALIGLHVLVSAEWDASAAEMETIKQKVMDTSKVLYNVTDGQMFIEQAEVVDDKKHWDDADFRVYADQSLRANVPNPPGGFLSGGSRCNVHIKTPPAVYTHEFGHYGFAVRDEYVDDDPSVTCTAFLKDTTPGNVFKLGGSKASCIMSDAGQPKLCSHRGENPHVRGTRQGDSSCWTTFASNYRDSGGNPRWTLRTPDTRGTIPGPINGGNLPLDDMASKVTFENAARANLCQPVTVLSQNSNGTPDVGRKIWLSTTYGRTILQGKTNTIGQLTVTGTHVGDTINGLKVQFVNCTLTAGLPPGRTRPQPTARAIPASFAQDVEQGREQLKIGPAPFEAVMTLRPTRGGALVTVSFADASGRPVALAKTPVVKVTTEGVDASTLRLRYDAKAKSYSGAINRLPSDGDVEVAVEAADRRGQVVQSSSTFLIGRPDPKGETEITSADGQLMLTVPAGVMPAGARVAIGPSPAALPRLPEGYAFVSGPYGVWAHPSNELYRPARITFRPPTEAEGSALEDYAQDSLRIFHYDGRKWVDIGGVVHPHPVDIVTARTTHLGLFALVGRRAAKSYLQAAPAGVLLQTFGTQNSPSRLTSLTRP